MSTTLPPPPSSLLDRSRAYAYAASMIARIDGSVADKELEDICGSLRLLGADEALIGQLLGEVNSLMSDGGGNFGGAVYDVVSNFGQIAPGPEIVSLYELLIWTVIADAEASVAEWEALFLLGDALTLGLPAQLYILTRWMGQRMAERQARQG